MRRRPGLGDGVRQAPEAGTTALVDTELAPLRSGPHRSAKDTRITELGIYSFGDVQRDPNSGAVGSTADARRDLREAIALADAVGLDYFGVGEHHTYEMPAFAGEVILASFFVG
jgi:hypothetical protein